MCSLLFAFFFVCCISLYIYVCTFLYYHNLVNKDRYNISIYSLLLAASHSVSVSTVPA